MSASSTRYLKYLNNQQQKAYKYHCWSDGFHDYSKIIWCNETFGSKRKRWQTKIIPSEGYCRLFMFRNQADAVAFSLIWT